MVCSKIVAWLRLFGVLRTDDEMCYLIKMARLRGRDVEEGRGGKRTAYIKHTEAYPPRNCIASKRESAYIEHEQITAGIPKLLHHGITLALTDLVGCNCNRLPKLHNITLRQRSGEPAVLNGRPKAHIVAGQPTSVV